MKNRRNVGEIENTWRGNARARDVQSSALSAAIALVAPAEAAFRSRWRLGTLLRADPELHALLVEQIDLYNQACVTGSDAELDEQAAAMVRGWAAAVRALESPLLPDDAYQVGFDANTGTRVVIAEQSGSVGRVQRVAGERVLIVTPDEVARMVAGMTIIAEAKQFFPDAEILKVEGL